MFLKLTVEKGAIYSVALMAECRSCYGSTPALCPYTLIRDNLSMAGICWNHIPDNIKSREEVTEIDPHHLKALSIDQCQIYKTQAKFLSYNMAIKRLNEPSDHGPDEQDDDIEACLAKLDDDHLAREVANLADSQDGIKVVNRGGRPKRRAGQNAEEKAQKKPKSEFNLPIANYRINENEDLRLRYKIIGLKKEAERDEYGQTQRSKFSLVGQRCIEAKTRNNCVRCGKYCENYCSYSIMYHSVPYGLCTDCFEDFYKEIGSYKLSIKLTNEIKVQSNANTNTN